MVVVLKPGARYRSTNCTSEVVVVRGAGETDLRCGGAPMVDVGDDQPSGAEPVPPFDQGTLIGKRYVNEDAGVEVLCVRAGSGSLALGSVPLVVQSAKPLPASD